MARANIDTTRKKLAQREEVEQLDIDGDTATHEAVFRALVDDVTADFEQFIEEELDVEITREKYVVFGEEVVMR